MIVSGSGHRMDKLGGYNDANMRKLVEFAKMILKELSPEKVNSGMAQGWDLALAIASYRLGIPFSAIIPFIGQEKMWNEKDQTLYRNVLSKANNVVVVSEGGYQPWKMQKRNQALMNDCDKGLFLWNGDSSGGTYNCYQYAQKIKRETINVWDKWTIFPASP